MQINAKTIVALIVAGLTASGADWLLQDHPALQGKSTVEHWLLPALTAWVIGITLFQLPQGGTWWAVFAIGGFLLMLVLTAEYIVVDPADVRYPLAAVGLTAVSFMLYLTLGIVLKTAEVRLFFIMPAMALAAGLVSLRTLHLRLQGEWRVVDALVITVIMAQFTAVLQYWPLSPVAFGLILLGPAYALVSLMSGIAEGVPLNQAILEPALVLVIVLGAALWIR